MSAEKLVVIEDSYFYHLNQVDIKKYIKKKGKFSYFPWAVAHQLMKQYDPLATVTEKEFPHYEMVGDRLIVKNFPYQTTPNSSYVEVTVEFKGQSETEIYPVLDYSNKDIAEPTMSQVNKALKRAFVKALAKHGLGLYIYKGEDLPEAPTISLKDLEKVEKLIDSLNELTDQDTLPTLIDRANKYIKQEFSHMGLLPIEEIESMDKNQYGIFLRVLNEATNKAKQTQKK